jgi:hypothetical protein
MHHFASWIAAAAVALGAAQAQSTNPLIAEGKQEYTNIKNFLLKAADKMPEEDYGFKPAPELQSFGERVAHMSAQIRTCGAVKGEQKQSTAASKTSKVDLVAALKAAFDECDAAWDSITDANALEIIDAGRGKRSRLGTLISNTRHDNEVYGTMTVYMRLKGIVPPSSEGH